MQADLLTSVILPASLFLIMFGMGLSLKMADFSRVLQAPKVAAVGLSAQLILLPLVAFAIAIVLSLPPELAIGLMIIALAPGGVTSNVFTYFAKGDVALSISLTAVVSLITPFTLPLVTLAAMGVFMESGDAFALPLVETIKQLLVITVVPVALGMLVLKQFPQFANKLEKVLSVFAIVFLLLIIMLILLKNKDNVADFFVQAGVATFMLNALVLLSGYLIAKKLGLAQPQATAIGFEVGIQNGTLALLVAGTIIGNETMMIPAVTYSVLMFFTGAAFAYWMRKKAA